MHGFPEVDGVQRLDDVAALFEHPAALYQHRTLRVSDHIGAVHLHQIWLYKKPCLAGAGTADDEYVLVSSVLRLLRAAVHGQELRLR